MEGRTDEGADKTQVGQSQKCRSVLASQKPLIAVTNSEAIHVYNEARIEESNQII